MLASKKVVVFQLATSFKRRAAAIKQQQARNIDVTYKQGMFIQCQAKVVLFGGAAGG